MRAVVQRVLEASVEVGGQKIAGIGQGLLVLLGAGRQDEEADVVYLANKVAGLRIFEDDSQRMNRSVLDIGGQVLVVPNFTLYGDCRRGRRPSFEAAAPPEKARALFELFVNQLIKAGVSTRAGRFRAEMKVFLVNDGPVTILLDSRKTF
ncbi:D-tyrosyl-tRNA(Tyr) deacylase [Thermosulfuriphilus ammonigenes]|uniref:D-aminoacyl-tRNA deacylase n=1 Tax=Thermosulfuriphilus ammonigenes TaxID=1936021 RepID=A0A6G7PUG4_9BACT|nr:D-aminoacyl-tRNA deacylase [Thermosulfuriphilus ammonigenes]MBA2848704.1 D-tyrosyl-tRNA(Tyr) deacylase [Thermosulfuriphilus ammonigenes]QIJ71161.1 D-tyrosyl-tRNA(Tyr) deacylase [Thermosulfuriphilus ammonigenes]